MLAGTSIKPPGHLLPRLFRPLRFNAMRKATIRWGSSTAAREIPIGIRWKQHSVRVTAVAFASGCAAITAVLRTLRPGHHVLVPDDVFQGTIRILREILPK